MQKVLLAGCLTVVLGASSFPAAWAQDEDVRRARVLLDWSKHTSRYQRVEARLNRYVYDTVFCEEKRATGRWLYDSSGEAKLVIERANIAPGEVSRRIDKKSGQPFKLSSDMPMTWVLDWPEIAQFDPTQKTFERYIFPAAEAEPFVSEQGRRNRPWNLGWFSVVFEFPMPRKASDADVVGHYRWETVSLSQDQIRLHGVVKQDRGLIAAREIDVILRGESCKTYAFRLIDPSGNIETVYTFSDMRINRPWSDDVGPDPFRPSRDGFREVKY